MAQPDLSKLREDASYCFKRADEISKQEDSDGLLSDEQKTEIKDLQEKGNGFLGQIKDVEDTQEIQRDAAANYEKHLRPKDRKVLPPPIGDVYEAKHLEIPRTHPRRFASFLGKEAERNAHMSGLWLTAKMFGATQSKSVRDAERQLRDYFPEVEHRALGTTTNAAGGALVPQELAAAIIERREQFGVFERHTNRVPIVGQALWPRVTSNSLASFGVEGAAITESDAAFDDIQLSPKRLGMLTRINNQLINSSAVDIAEFVAQDFGRGFAQRIDTVGFTAAGEVANGGLTGAFRKLQANTNFAGNIVAAGATFAAVTTANLTNLRGILPQYAGQAEPFWFCSNAAKEGIFGRLQLAAGGVTKLETTLGTFDSYNGVPIAVTQLAPSSTGSMTTGDVFLLLGDLRLASFMGVSDEITFTSSGDRYFEFDQTAIKGVMGVDINVYDIGTTTAGDEGSIVALRST